MTNREGGTKFNTFIEAFKLRWEKERGEICTLLILLAMIMWLNVVARGTL